ncbi:MAG: hypothetical protein JWP44_4515 [Mucilaginibacter sp.]|nr:hypothetical protein [Mucilaginibacter sp.]
MSDLEGNAEWEAKLARVTAWAVEHGYVDWPEAQERLGLTSQELYAAREIGLVQTVYIPRHVTGPLYAGGTRLQIHDLTTEERQQIDDNVFITRKSAAARLGISPAKFDKLRKHWHVDPTRTLRGDSGWPVYLYRQSDIKRLARHLEPL